MEKLRSEPVFPTRGYWKEKVFAVRNANAKLLRKRRGYDEYFARSLALVDLKLRKVQIYRTCRTQVQTVVQPTYEADRGNARGEHLVQAGYVLPAPRLSREGVSEIKRVSAGVAVQGKQLLKKYAQRCMSVVTRRQRRVARRLQTWEDMQKRREKQERDRRFKEDLARREQLYNELGPSRFEELLRLEERARRQRGGVSRPFYFDEKGNRVRFRHSQYTVYGRSAVASSSLEPVPDV